MGVCLSPKHEIATSGSDSGVENMATKYCNVETMHKSADDFRVRTWKISHIHLQHATI